MWESYVALLFVHFEIIFFFGFWPEGDPLMTFDLQMVDTLKFASDNNACVVMALLYYVICKYSDLL